MDPEAEVISQVLLDWMVKLAKDRQAEVGRAWGAAPGTWEAPPGTWGAAPEQHGQHELHWPKGEWAPRVLIQVPGGWQLPGPLRLP